MLYSFTLSVESPRYAISTGFAYGPLPVARNHMLCFSTHHHTSQTVMAWLIKHTTPEATTSTECPAPAANGFGAAGSAVRAAVGSECAGRTAAGSWREGYSGTL